MKKKKYSIINNSQYAISGFIYAFKNETSLKLDLIFGIFSIIIALILHLEIYEQLFIILTVFLIWMMELINTAIEKVVDLVTTNYAELAKYAKDIGATAVLFSVILHILTWIIILFNNFL